MKTYRFGRRELLTLGTLILLGPTQRLFPSQTAQLAGRAGWLAALCALPAALLYIWFLSTLMGARREDEGLSELSLRLLGPWLGRAALLLAGLWFLLYAAFILRSGADRLIVTIYPSAQPTPFIIVTGLLSLLAALGSARTLVRMARIIQPIVIGALILVVFFAFLTVKLSFLLPLTVDDVFPTAKASTSAISIFAMGAYSLCFIEGGTEKKPGRFRGFALWCALAALLMTALDIAIIGNFGAELTGVLTRPFSVLVRNLVFFRTVERVEALVIMLWMFPDFLLVSLSLFIAQRSLRLALGQDPTYKGERLKDMSGGRYIVWLCALAATVCSLFIAPDNMSMHFLSETLIPRLSMGFAFIYLPLIYIGGKLRKTL